MEHKDVYTAGTNSRPEELLSCGNIPVIYTGRGGKFTYHGPGQRVIYPVIDLANNGRQKDLKLYIKMLEEWIVNVLAEFGLKAFTREDRVGIWVRDNNTEAKIAAIGVRVRKWVTYHGIAVNISSDPGRFSGIIACGIANFPVTSLKQLGIDIEMSYFDQILKNEFTRVFT